MGNRWWFNLCGFPLSFLLFAGALHVDLNDLARQKWVIAILATASVVGATFLIGGGAWLLFRLLGLEVPLIYCLLFGALISPTDPIAVLGVLRSAGAPEPLETKITGESLFNDGVAVVVFLVIAGIAIDGQELTTFGVVELLAREAIGGALFGLMVGSAAFLMLRRIDSYQVEVLITLALATGGYALAEHLHLSAPIAIVVAGLLIGNQGRQAAMSTQTRRHLDDFWELVDEILNAVLFVRRDCAERRRASEHSAGSAPVAGRGTRSTLNFQRFARIGFARAAEPLRATTRHLPVLAVGGNRCPIRLNTSATSSVTGPSRPIQNGPAGPESQSRSCSTSRPGRS